MRCRARRVSTRSSGSTSTTMLPGVRYILICEYLEPLAFDERQRRLRAGPLGRRSPRSHWLISPVVTLRWRASTAWLTFCALNAATAISAGDSSSTLARQSASNLRMVVLSMTPALRGIGSGLVDHAGDPACDLYVVPIADRPRSKRRRGQALSLHSRSVVPQEVSGQFAELLFEVIIIDAVADPSWQSRRRTPLRASARSKYDGAEAA